MPIINAPFRLYYAYNPLRLLRAALLQTRSISAAPTKAARRKLITRPVFPPGGAATIPTRRRFRPTETRNLFREPRKTFRLTVFHDLLSGGPVVARERGPPEFRRSFRLE